eukprot:gene6667-10831_t
MGNFRISRFSGTIRGPQKIYADRVGCMVGEIRRDVTDILRLRLDIETNIRDFQIGLRERE